MDSNAERQHGEVTAAIVALVGMPMYRMFRMPSTNRRMDTMLKETISTAIATTAAVLLVSSGIVGSATPWHGVVLALVALAFGLVALFMIEGE